MSRTTRRNGWTYWESNKREAVLRNSFFGNRYWISQMPEDYQYRINDVPGLCEAKYIHRDLGKQFRQNVYMGYLEYNKYGIRAKQRDALRKVLKGEDYFLDERALLINARGIAEWEGS